MEQSKIIDTLETYQHETFKNYRYDGDVSPLLADVISGILLVYLLS